MNKLTEKIVPIMNEQELRALIVAHYEGEAQTLTSGAEANLLKFRELNSLMSEKDQARWKEIKDTFQKNQKLRGLGGNADQMAQVLLQMSAFTDSLEGIKQTLEKGLGK
jgi:hypothetical protein